MAKENVLVDIFINAHNNAKRAFDDAIKSTNELTDANERLGVASKELNKQIKEENKAFVEAGDGLKGIAGRFNEIERNFKKSSPALAKFRSDIDEVTTSLKSLLSAPAKERDEISKFFDDLSNKTDNHKAKLAAHTEVVKQNGKAIRDSVAESELLKKVTEELIESDKNFVDIQREKAKLAKKMAQDQRNLNNQYLESARLTGRSTEEIKKKTHLENGLVATLENKLAAMRSIDRIEKAMGYSASSKDRKYTQEGYSGPGEDHSGVRRLRLAELEKDGAQRRAQNAERIAYQNEINSQTEEYLSHIRQVIRAESTLQESRKRNNNTMLDGMHEINEEQDELTHKLKEEIRIRNKIARDSDYNRGEAQKMNERFDDRQRPIRDRIQDRLIRGAGGDPRGSRDQRSRRNQINELRGVTSELRGFTIAFVTKNVDGLLTAVTGAIGGLVALASSAISAGSALAGGLAAGAAQAIGPLAVLASVMGRLGAIQKVLTLQDQVEAAAGHRALAAGANQAAGAERGLERAQNSALKAQRELNKARKEAKRDLQDMYLMQMKNTLGLEAAQRAYDVARQGNDHAEIAEAKLALDEAKLKSKRDADDYRGARKLGVEGAPGVVSARENLTNATNSLAGAQDRLASSGIKASAAESRLSYMLAQLSPAERELVKSITKLKDEYSKGFRGISDIIVRELNVGVKRATRLFDDGEFTDAFSKVAASLAGNMRRITDFLFSQKTLDLAKFFVGSSADMGTIDKFTDSVLNLAKAFLNIASVAMPIFNETMDGIVRQTEKFFNVTEDTNKLTDFFKESEQDLQAWKNLLGSIWNLFRAIFDPSRDAGRDMITGWAEAINNFAEKLRESEGAVREFFGDSADVSTEILRVVFEIGKALHEVFNPASAKQLGRFITDLLLPSMVSFVKIMGFVAMAIQDVLLDERIRPFAQFLLTLTKLAFAFNLISIAVANFGKVLAAFMLRFYGGSGVLAAFSKAILFVSLLGAALSAFGVDSDKIIGIIEKFGTVMLVAFGAQKLMALRAMVTQVGSLSAAFKGLAASQAAAAGTGMFAGFGGMFGGKRFGKSTPNMPGSPIVSGLSGLSKNAKIGLGAGAAVGAGAALAGTAVGGKTGSFISGIGTGAATGAMVGTAFGPWGTAIGAVAGGLVGLGTAYLSTKDKQDEFLKSTKKTVDALYEQLNAIREVQNAKLDQKDTKLSYQQAQIDYRSARRNVGTVYDQLRAQGMSDKEAKGSDPYKQAVIERQRALIQLKRTNEAWKNSDKDVAASQRASGKKIITNMGEIRKNILNSSNAILKAQEKLKDSKGEVAQALTLYGKDSVQYKEALKNQKKAQDNLTQANKNYRKELQKLPQEYATVKSGNKVLGKSFGAVRNTFLRLIEDIVTGTNGVLKEFGADQVKVSMQGGHVVATGDSGSGEAKTIIDPAGLATGGFIGRSGMRGRDTVRAVLGKGEAVLNHTQQKVVNSALYNSGINGLGEVFNRTKGSLHYMARGGFAGSVTGDTDYMPALGRALKRMSAATGVPISVNSGRRTMAEQTALYNKYLAGTGNLAAKPSPNAPHVRGIAADISPGRERFGAIANRFGLGFTVPSESWHIQLLNAVGSMAGKASAAVASALSSPKIKSNNKLFRGVLNNISKRLTRAANKLIGKRTGGSSGGSGDGGHINLMPKGKGETVGASIFGGPGDPGTGHIGYRGDDLNANPDSYAELSNNPGAGVGGDFAALGGLPYRAKLRITGPRGSAIAYKRDVGAGGGAVSGHKRAIDLWYSLGQKLGINGLGLVKIQRLARGGFAGAFANGGTVQGKGAVPIIAHAGEWILNKAQQLKIAGLAGLSPERLRSTLGFSGGDGSYAGGGVIEPKSVAFSENIWNTRIKSYTKMLGSKNIAKMEKALRMLTADDGYFAQFVTALDKFADRLANQLKRATFQLGRNGRQLAQVIIGAEGLSIGGVAEQRLSDLTKEGDKIAPQRGRINKARRAIMRKYGGTADEKKFKKEIDKRITAQKKRIKNLGKPRTKAGKKKLRTARRRLANLQTAKKGVSSLNSFNEELATRQAEIAEELYNERIGIFDAEDSASADALSGSERSVDLAARKSVLAGTVASARNAGLTRRNTEIEKMLGKYRGMFTPAEIEADPELKKKLEGLEHELQENTQTIAENITQTIINTNMLRDAFSQFRLGLSGGIVGVLRTIGSVTGITNNPLIASILGDDRTQLEKNRGDNFLGLSGLVGNVGDSSLMARIASGANLTGEALLEWVHGLGSVVTTGWTQAQQDEWQRLLGAIVSNEGALWENTQALKEVNGNLTQDFSSSAWTMFRQAVFNGSNGLMPQYASLLPQMAVGGSVVKEGLAYLHGAEVVLNKGQAQNWRSGGDNNFYITNPTEVIDPVYLSNKFMFELNNKGI